MQQSHLSVVPKSTTLDRSSWEHLKDKLPNSLFAKNRARFISLFQKSQQGQDHLSFGFFKGATEVPLYSSDVCYPEYQEAYFYYLFGVIEMGCYGILDFKNEKPILFVPNPEELYKIWMTVLTKEDFEKKYQMEVRYTSELQEFLATECCPTKDATVFVNLGVNSDSGLTTDIPEHKYLDGLKVDKDYMHDILAESRVIKNEEEILALKWASQITTESHVNVMKHTKPGMRESQLESLFKFHGEQNYFTGRVSPYLSICGCAHKAATLHYHEADQTCMDGQTMLTD